jgi:hypothetical protein
MLRLAEAQQLYDALNDPLIKAALELFFREQEKVYLALLVRAIREKQRDTMKEAQLAGKIEAYELTLSELRQFAERQLQAASQ